MANNIAVLWDIQNVTPTSENVGVLVGGLLSYCDTLGNVSYLLAVGDWGKTIKQNIPAALSESGFELLYIPRVDERGRKTKDSVDFIIVTKATEMIFQYSHISTYVIITGDVDFRPLLQLLRRHGKTVIVIYNSDNVSERLLEFANNHKDYRDLIPDETDEAEETEEVIEDVIRFTKKEAFALLTEAIGQMESSGKKPTPGSVKVRMKMINDSFSGEIIGVKNWLDFINEAKTSGLIEIKHAKNDLLLQNVVKKTGETGIFQHLVATMSELSNTKGWIPFTKISGRMIEKGIKLSEYQYKKFKTLAIEAENRSLIELKNKGLQWSARLR